MVIRRLACGAALGLLVLSGCSKKSGEVGAASSSSASPTAAKEVTLDPKLVDLVKAHVASCTVTVESGLAYGCKDGVGDNARKYVQESKPAGFVATLASIAQSKDDPKASAVAIALLSDQFDNLGEDGKRKAATPEAIDLILAVFKDNAGSRGVRVAKTAAQTATIGKALPKLEAAIDGHPNKAARSEAYKYLMTFGRLDAFPKIKAIASGEHKEAALDAFRYMYKATDAEKAAVCPWAKGFLGDANDEAAASAGLDMVSCKGEYIDALLSEAERRLNDKQYKDPFAQVMREPCFEFMKGVTRSAGDEAQCDKVYAFLEKAANSTSVDDVTRGLALFNIYYQRRDDKTLKLMRKYEKSPNPEVSKRAKEAIKSLTETYKLKG